MADVNSSPSGDDPDRDRLRADGSNAGRLSDDDRGQLLLVAGLVMAVSLVALVVLLNASIYSENLATRGVEAADGEPLEIRAAAVDGTGTVIDATNRGQPDSYSTAATAVEDDITDLDDRLGRTAARRGGVSHLGLTGAGLREGRYVTGPVNDTAIINDTRRTRAFVLELDAADLPAANASTAPDSAVTVVFNQTDANTTHEAYVYDPDGADAAVATATNGTNVTEVCRVDAVDGTRLAVGLTGETIGGEPCPGIWPSALSDADDSYDIEFANTDGTDAETTATVLSPSSVDALESTPAVYDATLRFRYRTADIRFETTIRVAPGEPND